MPKKQNTRRKDGLIAVQVYLGVDENKKRKYKTVYGSTQKEANAKAEQIKLSMRKGIDISAGNDTFKEWGERWLKLKKMNVSEIWYNVNRSNFEKLSPLYNINISKISPYDIQCVVDNLREYTFKKGNDIVTENRSKRTMESIKSTAKQIFQLAIENKVIDYNPAKDVKILFNKKELYTLQEFSACDITQNDNKRRALTPDEQQWIIDTPHRAQMPAMIMMLSGLRLGELIPLNVNDIDLNACTITVNKSVSFVKGKPYIKNGGKTDNSARVVDIPKMLVEYLKDKMPESGLVCTDTNGNMFTKSSWKRMWQSFLCDLNFKYGDFSKLERLPKSKFQPGGVPFVIPKITAHWLRHTFATILYCSGVDVMTAKEQMGHSKITTTLGIYTHLDKEHKRNNMEKVNDFLGYASKMQV